jgi:hypothetical protein
MPSTPDTSANTGSPIRPERTRRQQILDWLAISANLIVGLFFLAAGAFRQAFSDYSLMTLGLWLLSFALLFSVLIGLRHRKRAAILLLFLGPIPTYYLVWWPHVHYDWDVSLLDILIVLSFLWIPAAFWLTTHFLRWPSLRQPSRLSVPRRILITSSSLAVLYIFVSAAVIYRFGSMQPIGDCGSSGVIPTSQRIPEEGMFVVKIIQIGYPRGIVNGRMASMLALGLVKEKFWGPSGWNSKLVILTQYLYYEGDEYLMQVNQQARWLTLGLPLFENQHCGHSAPVKDDEIQLRVLRDGPPKTGVRIIGSVRRWPNEHRNSGPTPGATVTITGPAGIATVTTDAHGIYDLSNLPPGHYTVSGESPDQKQVNYPCTSERPEDLPAGSVWGCTVYLR